MPGGRPYKKVQGEAFQREKMQIVTFNLESWSIVSRPVHRLLRSFRCLEKILKIRQESSRSTRRSSRIVKKIFKKIPNSDALMIQFYWYRQSSRSQWYRRFLKWNVSVYRSKAGRAGRIEISITIGIAQWKSIAKLSRKRIEGASK